LVDIGNIGKNLQIIVIAYPVRGLVETLIHNINLKLIRGGITNVWVGIVDDEILHI